MKIKELIEQLKKFDEEKEVIIRFGLGENDEMGYGLEPVHVYSRIDDVCIAGEYNVTKEDCDFVGQVDLIEARNYYLDEKEVQEKIIELMAKDIAENKLDEDICSKVRNPEKEECDCYADMYDACYGCVIEYYEKKARTSNE